ncbi:hypothetical protein AGABI1DRAFT_129246 [Agaricus bisporus var. burnettii JB137-S8]|uniref:Uncharacterized protein n=1 Tax=Agaricus bisporus var. burnettii (strain JB137-S8 / ATCC MYA-4627 / FGSC 10392) TaxID=597362 RepID=K5VWX6_AGABU|nr:uncharacterized protein AGABI1DRAFT_129246 [Agaricus bisporus var. burnettii JB137-S8]EKM78979.1 hypothetical protein AGABI1DRAFT_129246 [Agaricus bisporus var. burnettii JB137-S8]
MTTQTTAFLSLILQCLPQINFHLQINIRSPQSTQTQMSNASEPTSHHTPSVTPSKIFPENSDDPSNVLSTSSTNKQIAKSATPSPNHPLTSPSSPNHDEPSPSDLESLLAYQFLADRSPTPSEESPWRGISITPEVPSELMSPPPSPQEWNLHKWMQAQGIPYRTKIPGSVTTLPQIPFIPMYNQPKQDAINAAIHSAAPLTVNNNPYKSKESEMLIEIDSETKKAVKGYNLTHDHAQAYDLRQTGTYENTHGVLIRLFEPCQTCIPTFKQFISSTMFLIDDSLISSRAPWTRLKKILDLGKECWTKQELEDLSKRMLNSVPEIDKHAEAVEEEASFPRLIHELTEQMEQREVETYLFLTPILVHKLKTLRTQIDEALAIYYDVELRQKLELPLPLGDNPDNSPIIIGEQLPSPIIPVPLPVPNSLAINADALAIGH